jgi:hypothetical protein
MDICKLLAGAVGHNEAAHCPRSTRGAGARRIKAELTFVDKTRSPTEAAYGRKTMNWFTRTTSIAGIQVSNWMLVIVAVVVIWIIYSFVAH